MWPFCYANNPLWLLLPLLIGLATGWWAWGGRSAADGAPGQADTLAAAPDPEPAVAAAETGAATDTAPLTAIGIPAALGEPDDLKQIKGVGPSLNTLLTSLGVTRFDQIAAWTSGHVATVDSHLGAFKGRIVRDNWIEQARLLAAGAVDEFESRFGVLDSENRQ